MNQDQISIRDVSNEVERDDHMFSDDFDVAENVNSQNFRELRELVSKGRSIIHLIQNGDPIPTPTGNFIKYLSFYISMQLVLFLSSKCCANSRK